MNRQSKARKEQQEKVWTSIEGKEEEARSKKKKKEALISKKEQTEITVDEGERRRSHSMARINRKNRKVGI